MKKLHIYEEHSTSSKDIVGQVMLEEKFLGRIVHLSPTVWVDSSGKKDKKEIMQFNLVHGWSSFIPSEHVIEEVQDRLCRLNTLSWRKENNECLCAVKELLLSMKE